MSGRLWKVEERDTGDGLRLKLVKMDDNLRRSCRIEKRRNSDMDNCRNLCCQSAPDGLKKTKAKIKASDKISSKKTNSCRGRTAQRNPVVRKIDFDAETECGHEIQKQEKKSLTDKSGKQKLTRKELIEKICNNNNNDEETCFVQDILDKSPEKEHTYCKRKIEHGRPDAAIVEPENSIEITGTNCLKCGVKFSLRAHLIAHDISVHKKAKEPFQCRLCAFSDNSRRAVMNHVQVDHLLKTKGFPCPECPGVAFNTEKYLNIHLRFEHDLY